ncbi:MAG: hypothetical protein JST51_14195 [Armatimonadetes bacterium]|nr:hypothetical protein [Armatimonadota bacterium]
MNRVVVKPKVLSRFRFALVSYALVVLVTLAVVYVRQSQRQDFLRDYSTEQCRIVEKKIQRKPGLVQRVLHCPGPIASRTEKIDESQLEVPAIGQSIEVFYSRSNPTLWLSKPPTADWNSGIAIWEWLVVLGIAGGIGAWIGFQWWPVRKDLKQLECMPLVVASLVKSEDVESDKVHAWIEFWFEEKKYKADLAVPKDRVGRFLDARRFLLEIENNDPHTIRYHFGSTYCLLLPPLN